MSLQTSFTVLSFIKIQNKFRLPVKKKIRVKMYFLIYAFKIRSANQLRRLKALAMGAPYVKNITIARAIIIVSNKLIFFQNIQ